MRYTKKQIKEYVLENVRTRRTYKPEYQDFIEDVMDYPEKKAKKNHEEYLRGLTEELFRCGYAPTSFKELKFLVEQFIVLETSKDEKIGRFFYSRLAKQSEVIKNFEETNDGFTFEDTYGEAFKITTISKSNPTIAKLFPSIVKCKERTIDSHESSILLSQFYEQEDVKVVTGLVGGTDKTEPVLHSWLELTPEDSQAPVVVDFSMNAIMDKKSYYKLRTAQELSSITRSQAIELLKTNMFDKHNRLDGLGARELLLFYPEIMEILENEKATLSQKQ